MSHMPATIYWTLADRSRVDLDSPEDFLSPEELGKLATLRFPKRRNEWLLGRWTAKSLARSLPEFRELPSAGIEVRASPEGAPYLHLLTETCSPHSLSISHSGDLALCALTLGTILAVGADVEKVEPRSDEFVQDYFTVAEWERVRRSPAGRRDLAANLVWSAKEAMLKALGIGLRRDTRQLEVLAWGDLERSGGWQALGIRAGVPGGAGWQAWWQARQGFVLTVASLEADGADLHSTTLLEQQVM